MSETVKWKWWEDPECIRLHNRLERETKRGYWCAENFPPPPFDIPKELVTPIGYENGLIFQREVVDETVHDI